MIRGAMLTSRALVLCLLCAAPAVLCQQAESATRITLGVVNPVHSGVNRTVNVYYQKIIAGILLAIHHVNTRDSCVVGENTLKQLPAGLELRFRLADDFNDAGPAVNALLSFMYGMEDKSSCLAEDSAAASNVSASRSQGPIHPYDAGPDSKSIDAVIGSLFSELTQITAAIASLKSLPSMSMASTSTALADKARYPHFLRTVPSITTNCVAMATIVREFGWRRLGILYVDSEWGNSFGFGLVSSLSEFGVEIAISRSFTNNSPDSISSAVKELQTSGARILLYVDVQSNQNLGYVLSSMYEQKMGGGYIYIYSVCVCVCVCLCLYTCIYVYHCIYI